MRRAFSAVALVALVAVSACKTTPPGDAVCPDIPDGGCPVGRGDPCADPACAAAYVCTASSDWQFDHTCPPLDASPPARDASGDSSSDAWARDVDTDVPGASGGPGCVDLQPPDCALSVALACGAGCCGCEDLFVCHAGAWIAWGTCGDGGVTRGN